MRIGFIGLGDMGLPMARRLLAVGHEVVAWNRTAIKVDAIVADGAIRGGSPADVMDKAEVIGLCLTSDQAVEEVAFGQEGLFKAQALAGKSIVDFSTGSPETAVSLAARAARLGVAWVDGPVSGGVPAAATGALIVFAGGDGAAIDAIQPLLTAVASRVSHMGPPGSGQATKICNQMIVACNLLVLGETIALARKAGIDVTSLPDALRGGFADSAPLQLFGPRMASHQFEPRLGSIALMAKDVALASTIATAVGADVPMLMAARTLYARARTSPDINPSGDISRLIGLFESTRLEPIP